VVVVLVALALSVLPDVTVVLAALVLSVLLDVAVLVALVLYIEPKCGCSAVNFLAHTSMAYLLLRLSFILDQMIPVNPLKINGCCLLLPATAIYEHFSVIPQAVSQQLDGMLHSGMQEGERSIRYHKASALTLRHFHI
jgi:hypothetical protein